MSLTVTLGQMRTSAKQRANMVNSLFISDSEWNGYINSGIRELYNEITTAFGEDYYMSISSFTTSVNVGLYGLPADFYKLCGVDAVLNGFNFTLDRYEFIERNRFNVLTGWSPYNRAFYRLEGNNINLIPLPDSAFGITVFYVSAPQTLVSDSDVFDGQCGWEDLAIWDAVATALAKEESDPGFAVGQREKTRQQIRMSAPTRDEGLAPRVTNRIYTRMPWWYP